jgi:hypothetical protein
MTSDQPASAGARQPVIQLAAIAVAAIFLLVGALGFVPGIVTEYDDLEFAGHGSGAELFGLFQVSVLHNVVHLLFGVVGLAMSRTAGLARWFLIGGGGVYAVLWLYGLLIDQDSDANFVPVNDADNWLHLGLSVGMIAIGLFLAPQRQPGPAPPTNL